MRGTHLFQFGGEFFHQLFHFDRYDNVVGGLTSLKYLINSSNIKFTPDFQPMACSDTVTTNCLPSSQVTNWRNLYSEALGIVSQANVVATRTGANLNLNPIGTPLASYSVLDSYSLYFNDAWKIKPNLTVNYGLNWSTQMPPYELHGAQSLLTDPSNNLITTADYLANRKAAALNGQVYEPTLGFSAVGAVGKGRSSGAGDGSNYGPVRRVSSCRTAT